MSYERSGVRPSNGSIVISNNWDKVATAQDRINKQNSYKEFTWVQELDTGLIYLWTGDSWVNWSSQIPVIMLPNQSQLPGEGVLTRINGIWQFASALTGKDPNNNW